MAGNGFAPDFGGKAHRIVGALVPGFATCQQVGRFGVQSVGNLGWVRNVHALKHGGVDVGFATVLQQGPSQGIERGGVFGTNFTQQRRNDGVLADVFGDVFLGVVRPHLLLVDELLEDVAQHVGVDLLTALERALVQMPFPFIEKGK